ncbi:MAG TPA: tetratricopeptide repeat protein, partial [Luteimonas sp.]|nr:tetratricopeptide repeat protein [Luteimonas sp.]
ATGRAISLRNDTGYRMRVFLRRHRWSASAAAVAIVALLGTTGWALWQTRLATERAEIAKREATAAESITQLLMSSFEAIDPAYINQAGAEPTARNVLDAGAARAGKELARTPDLLARVHLMLGRTYMNLRADDKAVELLSAAAQGYAREDVNQPEKQLDALSLLAQAEQNRGEYTKAVELSRRVLALGEKLNHSAEDIANGHNVLGMTLISALRYDEADLSLLRAQTMLARIHGDPSEQVASVINNRGVLATAAGRPREGAELLRQALAMRTQVEAKQANLFATRSLLALAMAKAGRLAEAEAILSQSAEQAPAVYPGDDVRLARALQRLATVRRERGDLAGAQDSGEQAIIANARGENPRNPIMAQANLTLAEALELRGDIDGAARAYRTAEEIMNQQADASRARFKLQAIASHEIFLARHGRDGASPERAEKALMDWIAMFGRPAAQVAEDLAPARLLLAELRLMQGRPDAAEAALFAEAAAAEQPMVQARRRYWQARIHAERGDASAALAEYARAIGQAEDTAGPGMAHAALWRLDYVEQLAKAGRMAEARKQYALAQPALAAQLLPVAPSHARMKLLAQAIAARRPSGLKVAFN